MNQDLKDKIEKLISNNPNADDKKMVFQLKKLIYETELQNRVIKESKSISDLVADNINQLKNNENNNILKSGFADFDKAFGGFGLGEFIVIGGRPAMGKTQLLVNLSLNISQTVPVLYFTFDLPEYLLTSRFMASVSGIPLHKFSQHELTDEEKSKLSTIESVLNKHKIVVNESCHNSMTAFKAQCQRQIEENGVKVIIVDYLQLMSSSKYGNSRELEISHISRELKNIAKDFNVCVIATSQLSRSVELRGGDKRPVLSDLRESGAIEQNADKVIFIYRPEYYGFQRDEAGNNTAKVTELILVKNRNGSLGTIKLLRDDYFTTFRSFNEYKNDFSFRSSRLEELTDKNPHLKSMMNKDIDFSEVDDTPF